MISGMLSDQSRRMVLALLALLLMGWVARWYREREATARQIEPFPMTEALPPEVKVIDSRED